jgi:parallel beta-helix repeat protein
MNPPYRRLVLGVTLALGMLGVIPGVALAANPSCGDTIMTSRTLTSDLDCSAYAGTAITFGKGNITFNLNGYTLWGFTGDDSYDAIDTNEKNRVVVRNGTIANADIGVYLDASAQAVVKGLTLTGEAADTDAEGIYQYGGSGNTIHNNDISGFQTGIYLENGANTWVTNNEISDVDDGVYSYYESVGHFIGNTITDYTDSGWEDYYSGHSVWKNNKANGTAGDSNYGFYLYCDEYGWIKVINNTATNNKNYGFYTYSCFDYESGAGSTIRGNVANDNTDGGSGGIGFYDYYSVNTTWTYNTAKRNGDDGFYADYPGATTWRYNVANRNGDSGFEFDNNYGSGYGAPDDFSWNTANRNDYGFYAGTYGVPGHGNVARDNTTDNCYNFQCN